MTNERDETRAREAIRSIGTPRPDPEFRARMKREFAQGSIGGESRNRAGGERPPRSIGRVIPLVVAFAAAATILLAIGAEHADRSRPWIVAQPIGTRSASYSAGDSISTRPDETISLRCDDWAMLQIAPSSEIELPSAPGRWFAKSSSGAVRFGELRVVTGASFPGTTLRFATANATIEVTGTTFAVIAGADSSCLCVLEGNARIASLSGSTRSVPGGRRLTLYKDGREAFEEEILPMERMKLEMLREAAAARPVIR